VAKKQRTAASPAASGADWLTATELRTLEAVCEALIPSVPAPEGEHDATGLYARAARDLQVPQLVAETLAAESPESRADFKKLLGTLNQPLVGMLLAGRPHGFAQMSLAARQNALRRMSISSIGGGQLRQGFQAVKRLAGFIFYSAPNADGLNPNWPAIGYTRPPQPPSPEAAPKRIRPLAIDADVELTADAVIVGSGAGGGVMAAELAAAGKDVLVLEKGGYYSESDFTGSEAEMTPKLYLRRGTLATRDLGMVVLAGSTLGGGTTVNWSTSLRAPADVLDEWERDHGLTGATTAEFQQGYDNAERRMGVSTDDSAPNANNAALQRGCEALGYSWKALPRNASGCQQRCGACGYGCQFGRKQGTMLTFLQDAHDRGARIAVNVNVELVLIEAGRAVGVEGWATDGAAGTRHRVTVRAPLVVVAGGSVESPALLLRSGLGNPNIGQHLRLHPVAVVFGVYDEPIEAWTGSPQTVLSDHFARVTGAHGFRLEMMPAHPGLLALGMPWESGQQYKRDMTLANRAAAYIVLARDTGEGRITLDPHGDPVITYWPNALDRRHLTRGMQEVARIALAGGARDIGTTFLPRLMLEGRPGEKQTQAFLDEIDRRGVEPNRLILGTAHQMGTCRVGGSAKTAVADPYGEVYGVRGLFVADASTFPTASGVNPMLTTMAMAYRVAQHVKARG
jgi:choline dehydrogenase-like flavoprotein